LNNNLGPALADGIDSIILASHLPMMVQFWLTKLRLLSIDRLTPIKIIDTKMLKFFAALLSTLM